MNSNDLIMVITLSVSVSPSSSKPTNTAAFSHVHTLLSLPCVLCFNGRVKQQQMAFSHCQQNLSAGPDRHVERSCEVGSELQINA